MLLRLPLQAHQTRVPSPAPSNTTLVCCPSTRAPAQTDRNARRTAIQTLVCESLHFRESPHRCSPTHSRYVIGFDFFESLPLVSDRRRERNNDARQADCCIGPERPGRSQRRVEQRKCVGQQKTGRPQRGNRDGHGAARGCGWERSPQSPPRLPAPATSHNRRWPPGPAPASAFPADAAR